MVRSLGSLLIKPGRLTRAFVDGHRVEFAHPIQLYLWCTAAFFLLHAYSPVVRLNTESGAVESTLSAVSVGTRLSSATIERLAAEGTSLEDFAQRFGVVVSTSLPILLVGLVATTALLMAAQFRRESALTNVVFSLHWSAFYFSLEAVRHVLANLGSWGAGASLLGSVVALVYLTVSMQVVYRRGWIRSAARGMASIVVFGGLLAGWLWFTSLLAERFA